MRTFLNCLLIISAIVLLAAAFAPAYLALSILDAIDGYVITAQVGAAIVLICITADPIRSFVCWVFPFVGYMSITTWHEGDSFIILVSWISGLASAYLARALIDHLHTAIDATPQSSP